MEAKVEGQNFVYLFLILLALYFLFFYRSCREDFTLNTIADTLSEYLPRRQIESYKENLTMTDMKNTFKNNVNYLLG